MKQEGSIILLVLLSMSFLLIYCVQIYRSTAYMYDALIERQRHERLVYAARALAYYIISTTKTYFDQMLPKLQQTKSVSMLMSPLPQPWIKVMPHNAQAKVSWTLTAPTTIASHVVLRCPQGEQTTIEWLLERTESTDVDKPYSYELHAWQEH